MNRHKIRFNETSKYIFMAVSLGILINYIEIKDSTAFKDINELFVSNYGLISIEYLKFNIIKLIKWLIIHLFLIYTLSDYIQQYFGKYSQFIFTRTNKRTSWLINRSFKLSVIILVFYIIQLSVTLIIGSINGLEVGSISKIIKSVLVFSIYQTLILLSMNVLSIFIGSRLSIISILLIEVAPLFILEMAITLKVELDIGIQMIPSINAFIVTDRKSVV